MNKRKYVPFHEVKDEIIHLVKTTEHNARVIADITGANYTLVASEVGRHRSRALIKELSRKNIKHMQKKRSYEEVYRLRVTEGKTMKELGEIWNVTTGRAGQIVNTTLKEDK